jgi:hypothetical protein
VVGARPGRRQESLEHGLELADGLIGEEPDQASQRDETERADGLR